MSTKARPMLSTLRTLNTLVARHHHHHHHHYYEGALSKSQQRWQSSLVTTTIKPLVFPHNNDSRGEHDPKKLYHVVTPIHVIPNGSLNTQTSPTTMMTLTMQMSTTTKSMVRTFSSSDTTAATSSSSSEDPRSFRQRAQDGAVRMRDRAGKYANELRDSAQEQYRDFRDHPMQTTYKGAKSFGEMFRQYGPVFVGTYFTVYVTTLGALFSGVHSGILDPAALLTFLGHGNGSEGQETLTTVQLVVKFMDKYDLTRPYAPIMQQHPAAANLAVAWIAIKFTEPVRLPVAMGLTPYVARWVGWNQTTTTGQEPSSAAEK